jgi:hypothetical protein
MKIIFDSNVWHIIALPEDDISEVNILAICLFGIPKKKLSR